MKTRVGFVSNSSSSSYIIKFTSPLHVKKTESLFESLNFNQYSEDDGSIQTGYQKLQEYQEELNEAVENCLGEGVDPAKDEDVIYWRKRIAMLSEDTDSIVFLQVPWAGSVFLDNFLKILMEAGIIERVREDY